MTRAPLDPADLRADRATPVGVLRPGLVPYGQAWSLQRELVGARAAGRTGDVLILLEHPPVYTMGKRTDPANLLYGPGERARRGIELFEVDRGGDVTYHGPGQLVGYPILELSGPRVVDYVRAIEEVGIRTAAAFGLDGRRIHGRTGVWVGDRKLMAIGVRVSAGRITQHGFAFNVDPDLGHFDGIVPCGIADAGVCSLASLGVRTTVTEAAGHVEAAFGQVFDATLEPVPSDHLDPEGKVPA